MSVELIDEQELYEALRPLRPDRDAFEAGVHHYLRGRKTPVEQNRLEDLPPLVRAAASVLPLSLLTGGKASINATVTSGGVGQKLLGIALFPAVSLFLLLGATVLSVLGIRSTPSSANSQLKSASDYNAAIKGWWARYWLPASLLYGGVLALMFFGVSGWFYPLLIVSIGLLVAVVRSLAKHGLGNRAMLAGALQTPLLLIGQLAMMFNFGEGEIHFVDPRIVSFVFWPGLFVLGFLSFRITFLQGRLNRNASVVVMLAFYVPIAILLFTMFRVPPAPDGIKRHVEAFDRAKFNSATWHQWEIPARWTIEAGLNPNLTLPRKLFEQELAGEQNPFILGTAFRTGLVELSDIPKLRGLEDKKQNLLSGRLLNRRSDPLTSLAQQDWVILALVMTGELDDADRDFLAARLQATLEAVFSNQFGTLEDVLLVTQTLDAIDRPVQPEQYRKQVQALLCKLHTTNWGGFQPAGGFKTYDNEKLRFSDPQTTEYAIELMQIYGVPAELDLNWVRSYAKPQLVGRRAPNWSSAVSRQRLTAIPGVQPPAWWEWLYYERNLLAAIILVGLCIYAVVLSPVVQPNQQLGAGERPSDG